MQPLEQLVGQLQLALHYVSEGRLCRVKTLTISSTRLRLNSGLLAGKPVDLAPKLTGVLFSLCGTAQTITSTQACEQATGKQPDAVIEQQRIRQIGIETLFEHLLRLSQDWPVALGNESLSAHELQALFKLKRELLKVPNPAVMDDIQRWFEARLLGLPLQRWLDYCTRGDAKKLSIRGLIGNLMTNVCRHDWEHLGACPQQPLPEQSFEWWRQRLAAADAEHFMAVPDVEGRACETSSLTRQWDNPALQVWRERYGSGLMTRLLARVLDMLACWLRLRSASEAGFSLRGVEGHAGEGIALLQTARGLLVHRVVQQHGLILEYQIVAPTEWNFHPQGSLYHMLSGLHATSEVALRNQAQALIAALDPCVTYQLEITRDA
ncbi:nickel-dependent hydrogenase large subunit [Thiothrix lacustris]|uniref:nickel-dependent hydrogenase large subunit n=1 Tax=Thiothrix lacustris TaxID=525917 RepID=UPI00048E6F58|nr:nickel-dependent hydrogenase large subunit [Thiothrix lacustris]